MASLWRFLSANNESFVSEEQYGFRTGKGTTNAIFACRMVLEHAVEVEKDGCTCFIV